MKEVHLSLVMLIALLARILVCGATVGESVFAVALVALYGWHMWLAAQVKPPVNKDIIDRVFYLEESLQSTKDKLNSLLISTHLKR